MLNIECAINNLQVTNAGYSEDHIDGTYFSIIRNTFFCEFVYISCRYNTYFLLKMNKS